jgi:DHA2 family multidrug resistance protein
LITDNASWHWCFLINVPVGLLSLFLVNLFVDEPKALVQERKNLLKRGLKFDFVGFILVALFLGLLEVTLDRGQTDDWFSSPFILTTAIIAAVSFLLFIPWELTRKEPIVPIAMFAQRNFAIASIFTLITGVIVFSSTQFIPQLLQQVIGYTATDAGLALTAGGGATLLVLPLVGVMSGKVDARLLVGAAFVVEAFAFWNMSHLDTQLSFAAAAMSRLYQSVGLPFLFVPITAIAYIGLKPSQSNQASALLNVARNLGGTIGISSVQTMLAQREQFHQAHMVEKLNPLNPNYAAGLARLTQTLASHGVAQAQAGQSAAQMIYHQVLTQAQMLSYVDVFHILMILVLGAIPLLLVMQGNPPGQAPAQGGE